MTEVDLLPIYRALKARLKTCKLNAYDYVPGSNEWPGGFILPPEIEADGAADDCFIMRFEIVVLVSGAVDENQLKLLEYQSDTGERSIARAFRSEPTLGGLVGHVRIARSRPLSYEEQAGYQGFGAVFEAVARVG